MQLLGAADRWTLGFQAIGQAALTVVGGLEGFNPGLRSLRLRKPGALEPPGALISKVEPVCAKPPRPQLAIQERVRAALAESRTAREASQFERFEQRLATRDRIEAAVAESRAARAASGFEEFEARAVEQLEASASSPVRRTTYYASPNGDVLPATAYRYMDSKYARVTMNTMEAPLSYFGFEKFGTGASARDAFQIFYQRGNPASWSNARLRGTFDTLQLFSPQGVPLVKVPLEKGGIGPLPEPFTRSYPQYGAGGTYQLVPTQPGMRVRFNEVTLLPEK
jgi:hypothetical protein